MVYTFVGGKAAPSFNISMQVDIVHLYRPQTKFGTR